MNSYESWNYMRDVDFGGGTGLIVGVASLSLYQHFEDQSHFNAIEPRVRALQNGLNAETSDIRHLTNTNQQTNFDNRIFLYSLHQHQTYDQQSLVTEVGVQNQNPNIPTSYSLFGILTPMVLGIGLSRLIRSTHHRRRATSTTSPQNSLNPDNLVK